MSKVDFFLFLIVKNGWLANFNSITHKPAPACLCGGQLKSYEPTSTSSRSVDGSKLNFFWRPVKGFRALIKRSIETWHYVQCSEFILKAGNFSGGGNYSRETLKNRELRIRKSCSLKKKNKRRIFTWTPCLPREKWGNSNIASCTS